ncbi:hypothetical protein TNCV_3171651 [Trichonephila clavipes]|nr:hypothetical protein TNCV_3171651 [Trichonephila clavipes]
MAQRRHYTSEFCGICKSNRNGKKKMDLRECAVTTRKLNQKLVKDKFPLPIIEDVLDTLQKASISEDYAKKELITRIARWALQLEEFDYEIEHRAGSCMKHVDALSRYPVMMVCNDTVTNLVLF